MDLGPHRSEPTHRRQPTLRWPERWWYGLASLLFGVREAPVERRRPKAHSETGDRVSSPS